MAIDNERQKFGNFSPALGAFSQGADLVKDPTSKVKQFIADNKDALNESATEFNDGEDGILRTKSLGTNHLIKQDSAGAKTGSSLQGDYEITDEDIEFAEREADKQTEAFAAKERDYLNRNKLWKHTNPLFRYSSVNHLFSLGALSADEINFPKKTYRLNGIRDSQLVIRAGGLGSARDRKQKTQAEIDRGVTTEYFIDNIDIKHFVAPDKKARNTNAYDIDFEVTEPYSMGQFLQSLTLAAEKAGFRNYLDCPYLLEYKAVGYRDPFLGGTTADTVFTKYIPIKLRNITFEVKEGGSSYVITAIPFNEDALLDENQSLPIDVEISGYDLEQICQSGLNSLATAVNTHLLNIAREAKDVIEPDEIMITFPTDTAEAKFADVAAGADNTALIGDALKLKDISEIDVNGAIESIGGIGFENLFQDNSDFGLSIREQKEDFIENRTGFSFKRNNLSETLKKTFVNTGANVSEIGRKRILEQDGLQSGNTNFTVSKFGFDSKTKTFSRGRTVIDPTQRTINFTKGTKIQRIIEELVTISDFGRRLSEDGPKADAFGFVDWFRIQTQVYLLESPEAERAQGRVPRIFVYQVLPYRVHYSVFQMPNDPPMGYNVMKALAEKEYNYMYTGLNKDVLNFDIDFKLAFFRSIANDRGNRSGNNDLSSTGKDLDKAKEEKDKQGSVSSVIDRYAPAKSREIGVIKDTEAGNRTAGSVTESPAIRVARAFQDALVNSKEDLITGTLTIMGDPYYVCDTGVGNYNSEALTKHKINSQGVMQYLHGQVDIIINFNTPVDIAPDTPLEFELVPQFSGLYFVTSILSSWRNGQFTQELNITRRPNQDKSYADINQGIMNSILESKRKRGEQIARAIESGDPVAIATARADSNGDGRVNPAERKTFEYFLSIETDKANKIKAKQKRDESLVKAGEDPNKWFGKDNT